MAPKSLSAALGAFAVLLVTACTPKAALPTGASSSAPTGVDEDGVIPDSGIPVRDSEHVALRKLDPDLLAALQRADADARLDGVEMLVTSGWRSRHYQERLLAEAVVTYGSLAEARKRVNTPDKSTHVTGDAVDIGPTAADDWLIRHGAAYGLCQAYANEMWHFELLTTPGGQCPTPLTDASG